MNKKATKIVLVSIASCFLLFNIALLFLIQFYKVELIKLKQQLRNLENIELMFDRSNEIAITEFKYDQLSIGNSSIYVGSNTNSHIPLSAIVDQPKLAIGMNQNMCRPCVEGVFKNVKELLSDFETNSNIICIADIEQRFKDDYYGKKVISFHQNKDFPLYEMDTKPYLFIIDKDLRIKQLFIVDSSNPELTKKYLKSIKERYKNI